VGLKIVVAVSGAALAGWTVLHMIGTLSVFSGPQTMNDYARLLRRAPALLPVMRACLLVLFVAHVGLTVLLTRRSSAARPVGYGHRPAHRGSLTSRTMKVTGPLLGLWLVYHVLAMYGFVGAPHRSGDVYFNLVASLGSLTVNATYFVSAIFFGGHLWHGARSVLQTLGVSGGAQRKASPVALSVVVCVTLGLLLPSVAVFFGWLGLSEPGPPP
jgi:succinate dehydrogenase / fumarate reductase cytochrome b subunit